MSRVRRSGAAAAEEMEMRAEALGGRHSKYARAAARLYWSKLSNMIYSASGGGTSRLAVATKRCVFASVAFFASLPAPGLIPDAAKS